MYTLLTKIKHAKITTREVLIHLRKNGELKRKQYLNYLKMQYRMAGDAYETLQTNYMEADVQPEKLKSLYNKKPAMPVNLSKSELSSMSRSFDEITFLAEAWRFYQKEQMKEDAKGRIEICQLTDFPAITVTKLKNSKNELGTTNPDKKQIYSKASDKSSPLTNTHPQKTLVLSNINGKYNQECSDKNGSTPFCIQILKWTMEGQFNLN